MYKVSCFTHLPYTPMREHIRKSHNVTMLLYHLVFPVKYRKEIFTTKRIQNWLIDCCDEISSNHELYFDTIGVDGDHVHFLVQWIPSMSVTNIVKRIKSLTAKCLLGYKNELRWKLWWWEIRTDWYYANTVWAVAWYQTIQNYVVNQWYGRRWYQTLFGWTNQAMKQMTLFGV